MATAAQPPFLGNLGEAAPSAIECIVAIDQHSEEPVVFDLRFAEIWTALNTTIVSATEVGAALAVYIDKQCVVDLWTGHADAARTRPPGPATR